MAYIDKSRAICVLERFREEHSNLPNACLKMIDVALNIIKQIPAADVVEVVRCSDCLHYDFHHHQCDNPSGLWSTYMDGFCSHGERKDKVN